MPVASDIESCLPTNLFPSFESVTSLSGSVLIVAVSFLVPCVCHLNLFGVYRNMGYELSGIVGIILLAVLVGVVGIHQLLKL